jgi:hypothetical protein
MEDIFFHSFGDDGVLEWQGMVVGPVDPEFKLHLVQFYSFADGCETYMQIVRTEDMLKWRFYPTSKAMNEEYEEYVRRMDLRSEVKREGQNA